MPSRFCSTGRSPRTCGMGRAKTRAWVTCTRSPRPTRARKAGRRASRCPAGRGTRAGTARGDGRSSPASPWRGGANAPAASPQHGGESAAEGPAELPEGLLLALAEALPAHAELLGQARERDVLEVMAPDHVPFQRPEAFERGADGGARFARQVLAFDLLLGGKPVDVPVLPAGLLREQEGVQRDGGGGFLRLPFAARAAVEHPVDRVAGDGRERGPRRVPGAGRLHQAHQPPGDEVVAFHAGNGVPPEIAVDAIIDQPPVLANQPFDLRFG